MNLVELVSVELVSVELVSVGISDSIGVVGNLLSIEVSATAVAS